MKCRKTKNQTLVKLSKRKHNTKDKNTENYQQQSEGTNQYYHALKILRTNNFQPKILYPMR